VAADPPGPTAAFGYNRRPTEARPQGGDAVAAEIATGSQTNGSARMTWDAPAGWQPGMARLASDPERIAAWLLGGPLAVALLAIAGVQLAAWLPHYLTWPWWNDHDVFATLAYGWSTGRLPYRDLLANNFPGTIYLHWVVGALLGWGETWGFFALDAALLGVLGLALLAWSRRRFGGLLPGAAALAAVASIALGQDYTQAAQRDGHAALFAVLAILAAECRAGRGGTWLSGALAAFAFVIRPQTAVLWPAIAWANHAAARAVPVRSGSRKGMSPSVRPTVAWVLALSVGIGVGFAPLLFAGLLPDFARGVRHAAPGSAYYRVTPITFVVELLRQLSWKELVALGALGLLAGKATPRARMSARVWLLSLLLVLIYRPLSPAPHAYLDQPRLLVGAVALGCAVGLIVEQAGAPAALRLLAALAVVGMSATLRPAYVQPEASASAVRAWVSGIEADRVPPGYRKNPAVGLAAWHDWSDYRDLLAYLRRNVGPQTGVANCLRGTPALTGPLARRPALPAESIAWLLVRPDDEPSFAEHLRREADAVVVWVPAEAEQAIGWPGLPNIAPVIRADYTFEARFGPIEVWRRSPQGAARPERSGDGRS
jgi:hypothetical protein